MNQRMIAPAFLVTIACAIGLCVTYALGGQPQVEGLLLFGAFGGLGTALILWSKHLFPQEETIQMRHHIESSPEEQQELEDILTGGMQDVTRRKFLSRLGGAAVGTIGIAALFPLKSLGPNPGNSLFHTQWKRGTRLSVEDGTLVKPTMLEEGGIFTVWPEGVPHSEESATLLIKVPMDQFKPRKGRENWTVQGNVAYSKICTHVGCPVGLYRKATHDLLCPCHQSTFNVLDGARPIFGPAARSLPQLPLMLTKDGYLAAQSDYQEPVGPGFWNRGRKKVSS
jgi:ubiquinol-cytochrome c reductase iron-sulfur subunit